MTVGIFYSSAVLGSGSILDILVMMIKCGERESCRETNGTKVSTPAGG